MKLSIITVALNALDDFLLTSNSLPESLPSWIEWLVIDGDSSDGIKQALTNENRITEWISEPDTGVYNAYNKGLNMSSGTHVWFLNCGDVATGELLDILAPLADEQDQSVHCFAIKMLTNNKVWSPEPTEINSRMSVPTPGVLFPKSLLKKAGGFDENLNIASDYEAILKIHQAGANFVTHKNVLTSYKGDGISTLQINLAFFEEIVIRLRNRSTDANLCLFQALRWALFEIEIDKVPYKRWRLILRVVRRFLY